MEKSLPNKWLVLPTIILAVNFFWRLINQSQIIKQFPFDFVNDVSSYMAQLHFLKACGFLKFCPYWYNGFIAFKFTPPAWYFFTYPLYVLFGDVKVATYVSMVLIFILAFAVVWHFGRLFNLSRIKRIAFFFFLFGNAIAVGNFIRSGRIPELFAWLNFVIFAFILLWYKDRPLDKKYFLAVPLLAIILLSHQVVAVLSLVALSGLFLAKSTKEKLTIIASAAFALAIAAFWLVPYVTGFGKTAVVNHIMSKTLFLFDRHNLPQNIATFVVPAAFFVVFYFYWQANKKEKKEFLFFLPALLMAVLLSSRLIYFVPALKFVYPDAYLTFILFFSAFIFFKTDFSRPGLLWHTKVQKLLPAMLLLFSIVSVSISLFYTPAFVRNSDFDNEVLSLLSRIEKTEKFLVLGQNLPSYPRAYYSYAPVYFNLTTASGWYPEVKENNYLDVLRKVGGLFEEGQQSEFSGAITYLNVTDIISYQNGCRTLENFGWQEVAKTKNACRYKKPGILS